jgi:hypothetical protein
MQTGMLLEITAAGAPQRTAIGSGSARITFPVLIRFCAGQLPE